MLSACRLLCASNPSSSSGVVFPDSLDKDHVPGFSCHLEPVEAIQAQLRPLPPPETVIDSVRALRQLDPESHRGLLAVQIEVGDTKCGRP